MTYQTYTKLPPLSDMINPNKMGLPNLWSCHSHHHKHKGQYKNNDLNIHICRHQVWCWWWCYLLSFTSTTRAIHDKHIAPANIPIRIDILHFQKEPEHNLRSDISSFVNVMPAERKYWLWPPEGSCPEAKQWQNASRWNMPDGTS